MELDTFLSSPRWEMLQIIAKKPSSPIEIAEKIKTTVSYVSQQLKLLEAADLVKKQRTGAFERGKPRTIFSISKELAYIVSLTKDFPQKKLLALTKHHKIILRIWAIENSLFHYPIEKFYFQIEKELDLIDAIFVDISKISPKLIIISEDKKLKQKLTSRKLSNEIEIEVISQTELKKIEPAFIHPIYDTQQFFEKLNLLKGGKENYDKK